MFNDNN